MRIDGALAGAGVTITENESLIIEEGDSPDFRPADVSSRKENQGIQFLDRRQPPVSIAGQLEGAGACDGLGVEHLVAGIPLPHQSGHQIADRSVTVIQVVRLIAPVLDILAGQRLSLGGAIHHRAGVETLTLIAVDDGVGQLRRDDRIIAVRRIVAIGRIIAIGRVITIGRVVAVCRIVAVGFWIIAIDPGIIAVRIDRISVLCGLVSVACLGIAICSIVDLRPHARHKQEGYQASHSDWYCECPFHDESPQFVCQSAGSSITPRGFKSLPSSPG